MGECLRISPIHPLSFSHSLPHSLDLGTSIAVMMLTHVCARLVLVLELTIEQIARLIELTTTAEEPSLHHTAHSGCFWPVTIPFFPHCLSACLSVCLYLQMPILVSSAWSSFPLLLFWRS